MNASLQELRSAVTRAAASLGNNDGSGGAASAVKVERPKRDGQGDYSTNMAMLLAPGLRRPPREIAEQVGAALTEVLDSDLLRFEVAGPGFVNLFLSDEWYRRALRTVLDAGQRFGAGGAPVARNVLVEFVSANPTGPLVAASGRHAAYGDALSRVLEHHGQEVWREYYFNDAGGQIRLLGESVIARARGEDVPEGGYRGEYVRELAAQIAGVEAMSADEAAARAVEMLLAEIKETLERYGVHYDQYFSESTLHEGSPSYLDRALAAVAEGGHSY
ncbi:MAG: arginine--tRNA ligase, partial [Solirubrobacteraceae bacterium]